MRTLGALLAERRAAVVGRDTELALLRGLLDDDGPVVAVVHGVAGSGKSSLLRAFRAEAAAGGASVIAVDARAVEPTPAGFLAALPAELGDGRVVIAIDTAEHLRLLDGWLRQSFFPSLPANARVVIGTRDAPGAVWRSSFGELLCTIPLGPLSPADAAEVLLGAGLDETQAEWVNRFVRGHPLSLQLAASAVRERPDAPEDAVLPTVVQELAALWLDGLDAETREALDATCVLRRVTLSLLGGVLPSSADAFERLRALPFVELGREGLVVHDTVRECVAALLRATDPVRHREYRGLAWRQIRRELEGAAGPARWASLADMIHLVDEPLVREAFFPSVVQHYAVETARPDDRDAILEIVGRHESTDQRSLIREWWDAVPGAFRVARSPRGEVVAFTILSELGETPQRLLTRDPVCGPWRRHLRTHPVPRGQRVLFVRLALAYATGTAASPCLAALLRDMERASLEAGAALRRVYTYAPGDALLAQLVTPRLRAAPGLRRHPDRRHPLRADRTRPRPRVRRRLALRPGRPRPPRRRRHARRGSTRARARRPADQAVEAGVRRPGISPRARGPGRRPRGAAARRLGLRVDRRLERRRGRGVRAAAKARRARGCAGDGARRGVSPAPALTDGSSRNLRTLARPAEWA